jgi:hypothetical protein
LGLTLPTCVTTGRLTPVRSTRNSERAPSKQYDRRVSRSLVECAPILSPNLGCLRPDRGRVRHVLLSLSHKPCLKFGEVQGNIEFELSSDSRGDNSTRLTERNTNRGLHGGNKRSTSRVDNQALGALLTALAENRSLYSEKSWLCATADHWTAVRYGGPLVQLPTGRGPMVRRSHITSFRRAVLGCSDERADELGVVQFKNTSEQVLGPLSKVLKGKGPGRI